MRWWRWLEPTDPVGGNFEPLEVEASEEEILQNYFPYWCDRMRAVGKAHLISHAHCIEDFVVVHWAYDASNMPRLEEQK